MILRHIKDFIFSAYDLICFNNKKDYFRYASPLKINDDKNVLVIIPHVDDEILGIGGILSAYKDSKNTNVKIIYITDGRKSFSNVYNEESMALAREKEGNIIAKQLNCSNLFLRAKSFIWKAEDFESLIYDELITFNPSVVYTVNPIDINYDHYECGMCLSKCIKRYSNENECIIRMFGVQSPISISKPFYYYDIAKHIRNKKLLLKVFESQKIMSRSFDKVIKYNCFLSKLILKKYGFIEVFREFECEEFIDFCNKLKKYGFDEISKSVKTITYGRSIYNSVINTECIYEKYSG